MSFPPRILQILEDPDVTANITDEERSQIHFVTKLPLDQRLYLFEGLIDRYGPQPYFLAQLADIVSSAGSRSVASTLWQKAQAELRLKGKNSPEFDQYVEDLVDDAKKEADEIWMRSLKLTYAQEWKPTRKFSFPVQLPKAPEGHDVILSEWKSFAPSGSQMFKAYLKKLAIETNHIESTFLLTEGSTRDLVRRGISEGAVSYLDDSALKDPAKIKSILNDTLAAYDFLEPLVDHPEGLDVSTICKIHARLMKNCRMLEGYVAAGETRSATRKTVVIQGAYKIQCCPFAEVDEELEHICKMSKQWIKSWANPFATAAWIHLILVRCHPFDDGNGRLTRIVASIPLMRSGYPPICLSLNRRSQYYQGIRKAYDGDYSALAQCFFDGMRDTLDALKLLDESKSNEMSA
ncbi:putative fic/DOC family protein [Lyophyllum shimeji]|uniref:Fic/DOC family protein n=1 Tax=Lyophyllum shimeji TaxID=47721 RepID=A0A9P3UHQ9_LYOSH|nr:putative fic/DOC family protein [Lyophyllum shimeji]